MTISKMRMAYSSNHNLYHFDPENEYGEYSEGQLTLLCGLVPGWIEQYCSLKKEGRALPDLNQYLLECYRFPCDPLEGGKILTHDGGNFVYHYPEDPALNPYLIIATPWGVVAQYPYGFVAISNDIDGDGATMYRMD